MVRSLTLGTVRLATGRGTLRLTAPVIPGGQAWELSGLQLTRSR